MSWDVNTDFTLGNCLFGALKVNMNPDPSKFGYRSYCIGLDALLLLSWSYGEWVKKIVISGVDNSFSVYVDYKKKIS